MITDNDEQIKEYTIWSSQQQEFIEEIIQKLFSVSKLKNYKSVRVTIAKFVVTPNSGEPMRYIGFEDVLLSQIFRTLKTPKQYLQDVISKTVSEGLMNAHKDLLFFNIITTSEDIVTNHLTFI